MRDDAGWRPVENCVRRLGNEKKGRNMKFNPQDIGAGLLFAMCVVIVAVMSTIIGHASFNSSERRAAFEAYTQCLRAMNAQPIDVIQSFCGKIKEQL